MFFLPSQTCSARRWSAPRWDEDQGPGRCQEPGKRRAWFPRILSTNLRKNIFGIDEVGCLWTKQIYLKTSSNVDAGRWVHLTPEMHRAQALFLITLRCVVPTSNVDIYRDSIVFQYERSRQHGSMTTSQKLPSRTSNHFLWRGRCLEEARKSSRDHLAFHKTHFILSEDFLSAQSQQVLLLLF